MPKEKTGPRIILFDLETLPDLMKALKVFPSLSKFPGRTLKAQINSVICVGWKELGKKKVNCISAWDFPDSWNESVNNDKAVIQAAYEVLKDADAVVTHNGTRFDWPFFQTRLKLHGLPVLPKIIHIDTCRVSSRNLHFVDNRLNTVGENLTGFKKIEHEGWDLWVKVWNKDPAAMKKMVQYCRGDVVLLEKVYLELLPFITNLPNYNLWNVEKDGCPNCGSRNVIKNGRRANKSMIYQRVSCLDCRTWSKVNLKSQSPSSIV